MRHNQPETLILRWRAPRLFIVALLLLVPMLVGACSLTNLPSARKSPTSRTAQASPTPRSVSQAETKATPRPTTDSGQSQQSQAPQQQAQPPQQGGAWQVPAEQQAVVQ